MLPPTVRYRVGKIVSVGDNRVEFELSEAVAAGPALDITLLISSLQVRPDGVGDRESDGTRSREGSCPSLRDTD